MKTFITRPVPQLCYRDWISCATIRCLFAQFAQQSA